jgi:hypothetical protein
VNWIRREAELFMATFGNLLAAQRGDEKTGSPPAGGGWINTIPHLTEYMPDLLILWADESVK